MLMVGLSRQTISFGEHECLRWTKDLSPVVPPKVDILFYPSLGWMYGMYGPCLFLKFRGGHEFKGGHFSPVAYVLLQMRTHKPGVSDYMGRGYSFVFMSGYWMLLSG